MIVLVFIGFLVLVAVALIFFARRETKAVEQRWRTFASTIGGVYTARGANQRSSTIELTRDGASVRIFVFVGRAAVSGRMTAFNSLRATADVRGGIGRELHMAYMPDLQPEPILMGDDSAEVRAWLAGIEPMLKMRPGASVSCDGTQLVIDFQRKRDSLEDFQLLDSITTRLVGTLPLLQSPIATNGAPPIASAVAERRIS